MGMFDYLICEPELPLPGYEAAELQTKSFENPFLDLYRITPEGRLEQEQYDLDVTPESERNTAGLPIFCRRNKRWVDLNYDGEIEFHGARGGALEPFDFASFATFVATFKDGQLQRITGELVHARSEHQPAR